MARLHLAFFEAHILGYGVLAVTLARGSVRSSLRET
jgi:hypothetical protein